VPDYSAEVVASLVRGLGAFIRVAQTQKLTPELRPLRSFRSQALARHSDALFAALEDEDFRVALQEWLGDGQVPLGKEDVTVLRIAAERPDGWEEKLAPGPGPSRRPKRPDPGAEVSRLEARLAREQDKVRAARAEARRMRDTARRREETDARTIEELRAELTEASAELRTARSAAIRAVSDADRRAAAAERAARKAARAAEKAGEEAEEDTRRLRGVRRELTEAQRTVARLEGEADRLRSEVARLEARVEALLDAPAEGGEVPRPRSRTRAARPSTVRRAPLKVPKGRMQDDPQTLLEWLAAPGVRLLVDGYNVTKSEGGYGELSLERQRERLIDEVRRLVAGAGVRAVIVFDGSEVTPGVARRMHGPVAVEYSRPNETADDHLIALLEGSEGAAILVTSDRELQDRAAALGATVATSAQLLALIR